MQCTGSFVDTISLTQPTLPFLLVSSLRFFPLFLLFGVLLVFYFLPGSCSSCTPPAVPGGAGDDRGGVHAGAAGDPLFLFAGAGASVKSLHCRFPLKLVLCLQMISWRGRTRS